MIVSIVVETALIGGGRFEVNISSPSTTSAGDDAAAGIASRDILLSLLYKSSLVVATIQVVVVVGAIVVLLSVLSVTVGVDRVSRGEGSGIDSLKCITTTSSMLLRHLNLYMHISV